MNYIKTKNQIVITNIEDFNVKQILDCGQIFRYIIDGNLAKVYSKDKFFKRENSLNKFANLFSCKKLQINRCVYQYALIGKFNLPKKSCKFCNLQKNKRGKIK